MLIPPERSSAVPVMISTLDEPIVVKLRFRRGEPLFDACVREEFPHAEAPNLLIRN